MTKQEEFEAALAKDAVLRAQIAQPCDCDALTEEDEAILDEILDTL